MCYDNDSSLSSDVISERMKNPLKITMPETVS